MARGMARGVMAAAGCLSIALFSASPVSAGTAPFVRGFDGAETTQGKVPNIDVIGTEAAEDEKKICKEDSSTGSRLRKKRVCKTESQWNELHKGTKKDSDELFRQIEPLYAPRPKG